MKLSFESGNVNALMTHGIPSRPAVVAGIDASGKISLADEGRRGDSAANNFRPKV
jgi:hypothetical protein